MSHEALKRRLMKMEAKAGIADDMPAGIFFAVLDSQGQSQEVTGWKEMSRTDAIEVMREPGEDDEACRERAAAIVRAHPGRDPQAVPVMIGCYAE